MINNYTYTKRVPNNGPNNANQLLIKIAKTNNIQPLVKPHILISRGYLNFSQTS